jgi:DNA mismatch repair protein, C-terminal domain
MLTVGIDIIKLSGKGQFISIDSRPVSCSRGTLKQISSLYKNYLRSTSQGCAGGKLVDPFICMNIVCPLGSYDVNIEPAKDDVQFRDPGIVLSVVESFFQSVYGELKPQALEPQTPGPRNKGGRFDILSGGKGHQTGPNDGAIARNRCCKTTDDNGPSEMLLDGPNDSITATDNPQALELLLSPLSSPRSSNIRAITTNHPETEPEYPSEIDNSDPIIIPSAWKFTMYEYSDEDDEEIPPRGGDGGVALTEVRGMEENLKTAALDPWTIAKMNSTARGGPPTGDSSELDGLNAQLPTPKRSPQQTPLRSSNFRRPSGQVGLDQKITYAADAHSTPRSTRFTASPVLPSTSRKFTAINEEGGLLGAGSLYTWLQGPHRQSRTPTLKNSPEMIQAADPPNAQEISSIQRRQRPRCKSGNFAPASALPLTDPLADGSHETSLVTPRVSKNLSPGPLNEGVSWLPISLPQSSTQHGSRAAKNPMPNTLPIADGGRFVEKIGPVEPVRSGVSSSPGERELLDFRQQRPETKQHQQRSRAGATRRKSNDNGDTYPTPSPHSNRYQAARAALSSDGVSLSSSGGEDPLKYPISLAQPDPCGMAAFPSSQVGRAKTIILPLERIPAVFRVHNLSTVVSTTIESVERVERVVALSDAYVASGKASYAFPSDVRGVSEIESGLRAFTRGACRDKTGKIVDLNIDLNILMRGDLDA